MVTCVDSQWRTVLAADHDGLGLALPEVAEPLADHVEPRGARVGVVDLDVVG